MVVQYPTGYSDYLTGCCEPLSPPYRCHTSLKNVYCDHWGMFSMLVFSKWDQKLSEKLLCIFHSIPFDRARDSVLFVETASVVTGTFLTAQSASLYSDSVMN